MPCFDPPRGTYDDGVEETAKAFNTQLTELKNKRAMLDGALCAIANELDRRGILFDVFQEASRKGLIDLMGWLSRHKKTDAARLIRDLHERYSVDEINEIKKILSGL